MAGLIDTINEHVELWDESTNIHHGCTCSWLPHGAMIDMPEESRQAWRVHLTGEVAVAIRAIAHMAVTS